MIGYSLVSIVSYLISVLTYHLYRKKLKQALLSEGLLALSFLLINFVPTYLYYKSDVIVGEYSLQEFAFQIYSASAIMIVPFIIFGRWAISRMKPTPVTSEKISYVGENKLDVLHLEKPDLLLVQTASNYVEFYYLQNGETRRKMIRSTLTKVHEEIPELVRVHRSYLVNFDHFSQWEDKKNILIGSEKIPVSDKYRPAVVALLKTHP